MRKLHATGSLGEFVSHLETHTYAFVSVVVPVRNEAASIDQTLGMLLQQDYPRDAYEIIVVDGESEDRTWEIASRIVRSNNIVKLITNPRRWSSSGRNLGVRFARGDIVLVVDGHCEVQDCRHVRELVFAFETSGADIVGRPQPLKVSRESILQQAVGAARASFLGHHPDSYIYTHEDRFVPAISVGAAYRRDVFDRIGFFDESFDACEDVDFNHRADKAGLRCFLSSRAAVRYAPRSTVSGLYRQLSRYGRGRVRLWRKHPDTFSLKTVAPGLFVAGLLAGAAWAPYDERVMWGLIFVTGSYCSIVTLESLRISVRERNWKFMLCLPLVFATIHVSAGIGILQETIVGGFKKWFVPRTK